MPVAVTEAVELPEAVALLVVADAAAEVLTVIVVAAAVTVASSAERKDISAGSAPTPARAEV